MNAPSAQLLVMVGEKSACVKIVGRANFTSSIDFRTLFEELRGKGYSNFILDLSECILMDSTFLGVLAGFGLKMSAPNGNGAQPLQLLNPSARITELLENLGVLHLFKIIQCQPATAEKMEARDVTTAVPSNEEIKRTCIEAHRTLMDINPENVSRFKDVAKFLAEDLKKLGQKN